MPYMTIKPHVLHDLLGKDNPPALIDVLVEEHFKAVHLRAALNICVYEIAFLEKVAREIPDRSRKIVVYGSSKGSLEAFTAAEKLTGYGYTDVSVLEEGITGWRAAGLDLEGDDIGILDRIRPALPAENTRFTLDCDQSIIHWFGRNRNTTHHGTVSLNSGEFGIRKGKIRGIFEIDMASIKNIDLNGDPLQPSLVSHLLSEDFFFAKKFPVATFTIESAEQIEEIPSSLPNFRVRGIFELRGLAETIDFLASVSQVQDAEVRVESHFDIDRTRWGVLYGSSRFFDHLGYHLVYNLITLQLRLVARVRE